MSEIRKIVANLCEQRLNKEVSERAYLAWMRSGLIGTCWRHFRTRNFYMVVGFSFCATTDEWAIHYQPMDSLLPFSRPISSAFGQVNDATSEFYGCNRFDQVELATHSALLYSQPDATSVPAQRSDQPKRGPDASAAKRDFRGEARAQGFEGDACGECGNFTLVRNGTCMKCNTCGGTTGCS